MKLYAVACVLAVVAVRVSYTEPEQSEECPENCKTRTCDFSVPYYPYVECTDGCVDGYWGSSCLQQCPISCVSCFKHFRRNSTCFSCLEGYYLTNLVTNCTLQCPTDCKACVSATNCTVCNNGYYKTESLNTCSPCPSQCNACVSAINCTECKGGFTGQKCDDTCSSGCKTGKCDKDRGNCLNGCKDGFSGNKCIVCVKGKFGESCALNCSSNCDDQGCDNNTGMCLGCRDHYYGSLCKIPCSEGCMEPQNGGSRCQMHTGHCSGACIPGFTGNTCSTESECPRGYFKTESSIKCKLCPSRCTACSSDSNCTECKDGFTGQRCNKTCPSGCKGGTCVNSNGNCLNGCINGFSGDKCCLPNTFCHVCSSNEICMVCVKGKFGTSCDINCSSNCDDKGCEKDTGTCFGCRDHNYGSLCKIHCPEGCLEPKSGKSRCQIETGHCTGACAEGFIGSTCSIADNQYHTGPSTIAVAVVASVIGIAVAVLLTVLAMRYRMHAVRLCKGNLADKQTQGHHDIHLNKVNDTLDMSDVHNDNTDYDRVGTSHNSTDEQDDTCNNRSPSYDMVDTSHNSTDEQEDTCNNRSSSYDMVDISHKSTDE